MKILQYVFSFFLLLIVVGCSNDPEEVINDFKKEWDEVVIFTRKDNSLGRTDISYLENRFYNKELLMFCFHYYMN